MYESKEFGETEKEKERHRSLPEQLLHYALLFRKNKPTPWLCRLMWVCRLSDVGILEDANVKYTYFVISMMSDISLSVSIIRLPSACEAV